MLLLLAIPAAACIQVAGDRILAGELAAAVPGFAALDAATGIALAPAPGSRRTMSAAELSRLALRHGIPAGGSGSVCFERRTAPLERGRLEALLRAAWPRPEGSLELLDYSRAPVPDGEIEFRLDGLAPPQPDGTMLWRGKLRYGPGRSAPLWARVRILAVTPRVVAARDLPAGKILEAGDLRAEEFRGPPPRQAWCGDPGEAAGRMLRRAVRAGEPLSPRLFAEAPAVARGAWVEVEVRSGTARLAFRARSESAGRAGDWILVRNPESGKRFRARVEEGGRAVVEPAEARPPDATRRADASGGGPKAGGGVGAAGR